VNDNRLHIDHTLAQGDGTDRPAPPIICVVGKKKSGKTTFMEKLVPELISRGYSVGSIKHDTHGFDIDVPGKDTWRHRRCGVAAVVISSPGKLALIRDVSREPSLDEIAACYFRHLDLVLTEGYARSDKPKIELHRQVEHARPLEPQPAGLLAMVTDAAGPFDVPVYGLEDAVAVADLLERAVLRPWRGARSGRSA